ncbi:hypothetical protein [Bacillus phage vB_BanS-Thrax2]|nr:hypothetical protein [Bacillus phage vB_BanS-Thrax2]
MLHTYTSKPEFKSDFEKKLRDVANFYFVEVSHGIFHVEKDRHGRYSEWEDLRTVTGALKHCDGVLVKNLNGNMFSNKDLVQFFNN